MREFDVQVQCPECGELVRIFPCSKCGRVVPADRLYSLYKVNGCTKHNTEGLCQRYTFCKQCDYFHQTQLVYILHNGCVLRDTSGIPCRFRVADMSPTNIHCRVTGSFPSTVAKNQGMYPHNVLKAQDKNDIEWWKYNANPT